jgi:hypothetical protein
LYLVRESNTNHSDSPQSTDCCEFDDGASLIRHSLTIITNPSTHTPRNMPAPNVPKPGPAKLSRNAGLEEWLEEAKQCHYLPEAVMKQLCEMVKECLMEGV